jgi:hypothetical protein
MEEMTLPCSIEIQEYKSATQQLVLGAMSFASKLPSEIDKLNKIGSCKKCKKMYLVLLI